MAEIYGAVALIDIDVARRVPADGSNHRRSIREPAVVGSIQVVLRRRLQAGQVTVAEICRQAAGGADIRVPLIVDARTGLDVLAGAERVERAAVAEGRTVLRIGHDGRGAGRRDGDRFDRGGAVVALAGHGEVDDVDGVGGI